MNPPDSPQFASLKGRVILVTGAGSGLGREAAIAFATQGATVALLGRNENRLESTYDEIVARGGPEPAMFPYDLEAADDSGFERLAGTISYHLKRLDGILHSAAAFFSLTPLKQQTLAEWETLLKVNLAVPFALTRSCLPMLESSPDASVIFTGESHGQQPAAYWGGYAVSKSGLAPLTTIFSQELERSTNIRFNTLIPGPVNSPLRRKTHPGETIDSQPQPADLLPWYLWLMGPESRHVRGQVIDCSKGLEP
ncbi:MAG: SDR family NAD(P)-dependent oxidoreductase [Hydrogenophilaceae bacterium]|nr:SDR family NAD(P)-dependent oxidoreductase [Hydrogenophilaceae bacterium]